MEKLEHILGKLRITRADHLPIVSAFCRQINIIETVNRCVPNQMEVDVGTVVQAMVLDTLSGRSPIYRLQSFFENHDSELLLGRKVSTSAFNDTTVARAMDAVFESGSERLFYEVAFQAALKFSLNISDIHFDTTSVNVWGDYAGCSADSDRLNITYGKSKDERPDLKQFLIRMLCTKQNIPILGGCEDGNISDKVVNNQVLTRISKHLSKYGIGTGDFLYVADCAMVTEENLKAVGNNLFVTRLPFNYKETARVVSEAVDEAAFEQIGSLAQTHPSLKRPHAVYSAAEKTVTLYGRQYRAIVVHSTAHDKRRLKRLDRDIIQSEQQLAKILKEESARQYYCRADAEASTSRLNKTVNQLHCMEAVVVEKCTYARGRPPMNGPRQVASTRYVVEAKIMERPEQIQRRRDESGCFVLLTNVPYQGENARSAEDLIRSYKNQYGIERNFSFLKDPLIVNDLFLKKPERIEVLGTILLISLLVWNLIEHTLREFLAKNQETIPGWDNKPTERPTAFMMSTKFTGLQIVRAGPVLYLAKPLNSVQKLYLRALRLTPEKILCPHSVPNLKEVVNER